MQKEKMEKSSKNSPPCKTKKTPSFKQIILVVDDDFDTLTLQKIVLELEGFKVFTAQSGTEAFAVLSKIDDLNLILLDMQMEDMSGTEAFADGGGTGQNHVLAAGAGVAKEAAFDVAGTSGAAGARHFARCAAGVRGNRDQTARRAHHPGGRCLDHRGNHQRVRPSVTRGGGS
jgi:hypothetical protein